MKISKSRFVSIFVIVAFVFQFVSNSVLGDEIGLFPGNGDWYPGSSSSIAWKESAASVIYPLKYVLVEPLSLLTQDPDPAPPILVIAFAVYWSAIALALYYSFYLVKTVTRSKR